MCKQAIKTALVAYFFTAKQQCLSDFVLQNGLGGLHLRVSEELPMKKKYDLSFIAKESKTLMSAP